MRAALDVIAKQLKHAKSVQDDDVVLDPETGQVYVVIKEHVEQKAPVQIPAPFQSAYRTYD